MSEYDLSRIMDTMIIVLIPVFIGAAFVVFNKVTSAILDVLIGDLIPVCLGIAFTIFSKVMPVLKSSRYVRPRSPTA